MKVEALGCVALVVVPIAVCGGMIFLGQAGAEIAQLEIAPNDNHQFVIYDRALSLISVTSEGRHLADSGTAVNNLSEFMTVTDPNTCAGYFMLANPDDFYLRAPKTFSGFQPQNFKIVEGTKVLKVPDHDSCLPNPKAGLKLSPIDSETRDGIGFRNTYKINSATSPRERMIIVATDLSLHPDIRAASDENRRLLTMLAIIFGGGSVAALLAMATDLPGMISWLFTTHKEPERAPSPPPKPPNLAGQPPGEHMIWVTRTNDEGDTYTSLEVDPEWKQKQWGESARKEREEKRQKIKDAILDARLEEIKQYGMHAHPPNEPLPEWARERIPTPSPDPMQKMIDDMFSQAVNKLDTAMNFVNKSNSEILGLLGLWKK